MAFANIGTTLCSSVPKKAPKSVQGPDQEAAPKCPASLEGPVSKGSATSSAPGQETAARAVCRHKSERTRRLHPARTRHILFVLPPSRVDLARDPASQLYTRGGRRRVLLVQMPAERRPGPRAPGVLDKDLHVLVDKRVEHISVLQTVQFRQGWAAAGRVARKADGIGTLDSDPNRDVSGLAP